MNRALLLALSALLLPAIAGCGHRHVVVEPETAARANDRAWTVTSEPGGTVVIQGDSSGTPNAPPPVVLPARPLR